MGRRDSEKQQEQLVDALIAGVSRMMATRDGRRVLLILAICCILIGTGCLLWQRHQPPVVSGPTVRIATWNLHQFSPRPEIDLRRIAQIITDNKFDVVAVQEVKKEGQEIDALLNTLGSPWHAALGPINDSHSHPGGNNERFAFIYNAQHVREVGPAQNIPSSVAESFDRIPYEDTFEAGNFRFTLVTVHLDYTRVPQRKREVQMLGEIAGNLSPGGGDNGVIILGDFNEERHRPNLPMFVSHGWQLLISDATNLSSTEDFDNILIDPRATHEFTGHSGVVNYDQIFQYPDHRAATDAVSDHRPAWADFVTGTGHSAP